MKSFFLSAVLWAAWTVSALPREPIPDKLVVLTFDDASKSHFTVARPVLKKYGFGATFFITEGFDFPTNKRDYMTWEEIALLDRDGFEIGNHTRDHKGVTHQSLGDLPAQVRAISAQCRKHGIPVPVSFAYPGNAIDRDALPILKDLGIKFARRGGAPEHPYKEGNGFAYEPSLDHPLLIPSAGDARPSWTLDDFKRAISQARHGKVAVLQFHGVPDSAHDWVTTSQKKFEVYMKYLMDNKFQVIALRDLAKYVDPNVTPSEPWGVIKDRQHLLEMKQSGSNTRPAHADQPSAVQTVTPVVVRPKIPWDLATLRKPPTVQFVHQGKKLSSLYYDGEPSRDKPTRVFAYLALPDHPEGRSPAMVLVHGGGGTAFQEWAELWASRGYVALAMDLAGQGPDGKRLVDGGPAQDDDTKFAAVPAKDAWTYHAVAAILRGVSLLTHRRDVDPQRIGITGISWGGYLTCIVAGVDDRLRVAVPVYGCGFLHENSAWLPRFQKMTAVHRQAWVERWDPSRYLSQAKMPVLFVNGTNDFAYPLDSYQKSYRLVQNRTLCVTVNLPHGHREGWTPKEIGLFVDQQLKKGASLAQIKSTERKDNRVEVRFQAAVPVQSAALHYTTDRGPWQKRQWHTRSASLKGNLATAELPGDRPLVYFLTITDSRKATVSSEHEVLER